MSPVVYNHLLALTNGLDKDIKLAAITALGDGGEAIPVIIQQLMQLSQGLDKDIKLAAIRSLGRIYGNK